MGQDDNKPSRWGVVHDFTKTVVTLATSILALTITFSGKLTGPEPPLTITIMLGFTWSLLVFVILCGLWSAARLSNFLAGKQGSTAPLLAANTAFFSLVLAGVLFVVIGLHQVGGAGPLTKRIANIEKAARTIVQSEETWELQSLVYQKKDESYELEYTVASMGDKYKVVCDKECKRILDLHKVKTGP